MATITQNHIKAGRPNRSGLFINPSYITINDADNLAAYANAAYYGEYLKTSEVAGAEAWHFTVDDLGVVEHLPTDEMALHISTSAEDPGNINSIGVVICRNAGADRNKAEQNAVWLIRYLQALYAIPTKNIVPRRYYDGTNNPELLLPRWDDFIQELEQRDAAINPDRQIFVFDKSEVLKAVLTNGSPKACPYYNAVHKEQINGVNTLEFTVPAKHEDAVHVAEESMVAIKDLDEDFYQLFVIKEVEEVHEDTVYKKAFCEHAALELVDEIIEDRRPENETARNLLGIALTETRWEVGIVNDMGTVPTCFFYYESVLSGIYKIVEAFKCEVRYRVKLAGGEIEGRYVDLLQRRGHNTGRRFQYSRDMKKVARTVDSTQVKTALYGRGKGEETGDGFGRRITFADVEWQKTNGDPADKPHGQEWIGSPDALATFGRFNNDGTLRHRFGIYENEDQTDPALLLKETWEALQEVKTPLVEYNMDVVDLEHVTGYASEKVRLGDVVLCVDQEFNPPLAVEARVIELNRYLDEPDRAEVKLGNFIPKVTNTLARLERMEKTIRNKEGVWDGKVGAPDGVVETLRAEIRAGQGTVKLSHNNGIIITDNDYSPTKAMRLLGGIFALANSKDPVTGEWNWTTFGTANGFTADAITAGTMSFDRARGGTLTLGGPGNGYGRLQVYNETGDVIADLDAKLGGFRELYVGKLRGNVVTANYENYEMYVDSVLGDDDNTGLSESQPLRTIQRAIDKIPRFNFGHIRIACVAGQTYNEILYIEGFFGSGSVAVDFMNSTLNGFVYVRNNVSGLSLHDGTINHVKTGGMINGIFASVTAMESPLDLYGMEIQTNQESIYSVVSAHSGVTMNGCNIHGARLNAVTAMQGGHVYIIDCTGEALTGIEANGPSIIGGSGTAPYGTMQDILASEGGTVSATFSHTAGIPPTLPPPVTHYGWHISNVEVWNENQGWGMDVAGAIQGAWEDTGNNKTLMFLDTADIKAQLADKNIVKAHLQLSRLSEGGYPKPEPISLWMHNYETIPGNEPRLIFPMGKLSTLAWGEKRWLELPLWAIQHILKDNAKGFALYVEDGNHYAKFRTGLYNMVLRVIFTG